MTIKQGQMKIEVPAGAKSVDVDINRVLAQQLDDAVGDPVTPAEVMLFRKSKCDDCWGKGEVTKTAIGPDKKPIVEVDEEGSPKLDAKGKPLTKKEKVLCRCGVKALVVKHGDELIRVEGRLFWKRRDLLKNPEPTPGDATRMRAMLETGQLEAALRDQGLEMPAEEKSEGGKP